MDQDTDQPLHIRRSGHFHLALGPREAFPLFTAEGEKAWVPEWSPVILGELPQRRGTVFLTGAGEEWTIWTVIDSDPEAGRVLYSRVTPASRAGTVEVRVTANGEGSRVEVIYELTALSKSALASLEPYSPAEFEAMLIEWQRLIEAMPGYQRAQQVVSAR